MKELYKQIAFVTTYKLYNITDDIQNKSISFEYKSVIQDIKVEGKLDKTGAYLEVDVFDLFILYKDAIGLINIIDQLNEYFKEFDTNIELVGNKLYASTENSIDKMIKDIDRCLVHICFKMQGVTAYYPNKNDWIYPGIHKEKGRYVYYNKYDLHTKFMVNNRIETFAEYSSISGLQGFYVTVKELCLAKVYNNLDIIGEFFVLTANMIYSLIKLSELEINKVLTLGLNNNTVVVLNKRKKLNIPLGYLRDNKFYFNSNISKELNFNALITLY